MKSHESADFRFGSFELQPKERRLLKAGVVSTVAPRAFDVLVCLVERAGHLVSKEDLFNRVWPKVVVDDGALQVQISALRKILGAEAIETVSGSGYRFALPLVGRTIDQPTRPNDSPPNHNLPAAASTFVGRIVETERLAQSLARARLITLTGAGGCGKTRLALTVGQAVLERYPDGVWLVELAPIGDATIVPQAVMSALGVPESGSVSQTEALITHLASRRLLLILDNAEHLLAGCASFADTLLRECRDIGLLVTSRQNLGVDGEFTFRVPSLSLPDPDEPHTPERLMTKESVRLFVDRARLHRPHFAVNPDNAAALASICRRLDGIPLAIELAAGRLRSMPVDELSQRLNQRFSLLSGGSQAAQPRHRTLRSLIDWSYDLLSDAEQSMLRRISVFSGGCILEAAEDVCTAEGDDRTQVLDLLAALSDKSLIFTEDHQGTTRYRLLETVLAYARERLQESGETPRWQARHLSYHAALAEQARAQLRGPDTIPCLARLDADNDNLRSALAFALATPHTVITGMGIAISLCGFWVMRSRLTEARSWYAAAIAAGEQDGDEPLRAWVFNGGGIFASLQGDHAAANALYRHALAIHRRLGNPLGTASALGNLGVVAKEMGDGEAALVMQAESVAILRTVDDTHKLSQALCNLGGTASFIGDFAFARTTLEEALMLEREQGDSQGIVATLGALAGVATGTGDYLDAKDFVLEALAISLDLGDKREAAQLLEELAHVESSIAPNARAAKLWGLAEQLRREVGAPIAPLDHAAYSIRVAKAREAWLDDASFDLAWNEGIAMTWEQLRQELSATAKA